MFAALKGLSRVASGVSLRRPRSEAAESTAGPDDAAATLPGGDAGADVDAPPDGYQAPLPGAVDDEESEDDSEEEEAAPDRTSLPARRRGASKEDVDGSSAMGSKSANSKDEPSGRTSGLYEGEEENYEDQKRKTEDFFKNALANLHPKFKNSAELEVDHAIEEEVRRRLKPSRHLNSLLVSSADQPWRAAAALEVDAPTQEERLNAMRQKLHDPLHFTGAAKAPEVVVVTGHKGMGGNAMINGIYERYPGEFHGRPLYRKTLEKRHRAWSDLAGARSDNRAVPRQDWRSATAAHICKPEFKGGGYFEMAAVPDLEPRFMYFDNRQGHWCIGPTPGSVEVYARCDEVDQVVPCCLQSWQVWDVGRRQWYVHPNLKALRGGTPGVP